MKALFSLCIVILSIVCYGQDTTRAPIFAVAYLPPPVLKQKCYVKYSDGRYEDLISILSLPEKHPSTQISANEVIALDYEFQLLGYMDKMGFELICIAQYYDTSPRQYYFKHKVAK